MPNNSEVDVVKFNFLIYFIISKSLSVPSISIRSVFRGFKTRPLHDFELQNYIFHLVLLHQYIIKIQTIC